MNKLKAELYDKIHNVIGNYNDRMVRGAFEYDFEIDPKCLETALVCAVEANPVLHSAFAKRQFCHFWRVEEFLPEDVFSFVYAEDYGSKVDEFLCSSFLPESNVQFKVKLFIGKGKSTIAFMTNHMCMDGGDLKRFIKLLCSAYNSVIKGESISYLEKGGSRGYSAVYKDLSGKYKIKAKLLYSNPTPKNTPVFPLEDNREEDHSFIIKRTVSAEHFNAVKALSKKHGATINDVILAAYFKSLYELAEFGAGSAVNISSAIDLRRYIKDKESLGFTNHSAYLPYSINGKDLSFVELLEKVVKISDKYRSDCFSGLNGLPLLHFGFTALPAFIADKLVKRFYNNPSIALSNIGILYESDYSLSSKEPLSAFITGTVKYKPGVMVTVTTYKNQLTFTMCSRGSKTDRAKLEKLLACIERNLMKASGS